MFDILCVTNRMLCRDDFLARIEAIARAGVSGVILREKDLPKAEYRRLAKRVMDICAGYGVACISHSFVDAAIELGCEAIHLPMHALRELSADEKAKFKALGASCHSVGEAVEAQDLGCTYITAGHVFETDCKKGLPARGLNFLRSVCESVSIPVYAIGGIDKSNIDGVFKVGAKGVCIMSGLMSCDNAKEYLDSLTKERG